MKRLLSKLALGVVLLALTIRSAAAEDDEFLASLSQLVTRVARKEVREKTVDFDVGPLAAHLQVVDPDETLVIDVGHFELSDDFVATSLTASGRLRIAGRVQGESDVYAIVDVRLAVTAEARFTSEAEQVFIEPVIKDVDLQLAIVELLPAELSGSEALFSNLAVALFNQNKAKILAEVNQQIAKRPL